MVIMNYSTTNDNSTNTRFCGQVQFYFGRYNGGMKRSFLLAAVILLLTFSLVRVSQADSLARCVFQNASASTVLIVGENKTGWCKGTGFVYKTANGSVIITAKHVVDDPKYTYAVTLTNGRTLPVLRTKLCPKSDLAAVYVADNLADVPGLKIADTDASIGDNVYSIGYPVTHTNLVLGVGIVTQYCDTLIPGVHLMGCCQINHGNSGGPLLNDAGEVIGITDCAESDAENLCYGLPVTTIRSFVFSLEPTPVLSLTPASLKPSIKVFGYFCYKKTGDLFPLDLKEKCRKYSLTLQITF